MDIGWSWIQKDKSQAYCSELQTWGNNDKISLEETPSSANVVMASKTYGQYLRIGLQYRNVIALYNVYLTRKLIG